MKEPIGGYLPLEFAYPRRLIERPNSRLINLGRSGLGLILHYRNYRRVWVPRYICPIVFSKLEECGVEYVHYSIDENLVPIFERELEEDEAFLYVDYFGVKDKTTNELAQRLRNLIVDLTQAFFCDPPNGCDGFNSARKFIGVPDGGYVFGDFVSSLHLTRQESYDNCLHQSCLEPCVLLYLTQSVNETLSIFEKDWKIRDFAVKKHYPTKNLYFLFGEC